MKTLLSISNLALIAMASLSAQPEARPGFANDRGAAYLSLSDDPLTVERAIEAHLNSTGVKASVASGNSGAMHFVFVAFNGFKGLPNVQYRISALPPMADGGNPKTQLIVITFASNFHASQPNESVQTMIDAANRVGNCAWFLEAGEILCRSWLQIPDSNSPIPADVVRQKIRLINGDWARLSPQILTASQ